MIGIVENAILARLDAASKAGAVPYVYMTMASWPSKFDDFLSKEIVRYPACWSAYGGAHRIERIGPGRWRAHCAFSLVVAAENARNEVSRRQGGSPMEVGSYQMAEDALAILGDQTFGLDIDAFAPASLLPVETADIPKLRQVSLYAVTFETGLYYDTQPGIVGNVAPFLTVDADWDPAPYGHVAPPLPDDGAAVMADHLTLPQD